MFFVPLQRNKAIFGMNIIGRKAEIKELERIYELLKMD